MGLDADDPKVLANNYSVRVQATDELKSLIGGLDVRHPHGDESMADDFLLDASDQGRLYIKFQMHAGSRYAGRFIVEKLAERLTAVYCADARLVGLGDTSA